MGFNIAFNAGFAFAFVTAMFVMFYIKERVSRAKLLQFVSGVNKVTFWMTSFIIDYAQFILMSLIFLGVLAAYNKDGYNSIDDLSRNFLVLVAFGFSVLPFTYIFSFLFQVPSSGLVRLVIIYLISGAFFFMAYFVLNNDLFDLKYIATPLRYIFLIFPHYSLVQGMSNLNVIQSTLTVCNEQCKILEPCEAVGVEGFCEIPLPIDCDERQSIPALNFICTLKKSCCDHSYYAINEDGIGTHLIAFVAIGIVSFFLLFAIEYRWIQNLFFKFKKEQR